jgi:hypothetical protein
MTYSKNEIVKAIESVESSIKHNRNWALENIGDESMRAYYEGHVKRLQANLEALKKLQSEL